MGANGQREAKTQSNPVKKHGAHQICLNLKIEKTTYCCCQCQVPYIRQE
jgi:hypothetical protein